MTYEPTNPSVIRARALLRQMRDDDISPNDAVNTCIAALVILCAFHPDPLTMASETTEIVVDSVRNISRERNEAMS